MVSNKGSQMNTHTIGLTPQNKLRNEAKLINNGQRQNCVTNHPGLPSSNTDSSTSQKTPQFQAKCDNLSPEDDPRRGGYRLGRETRKSSRGPGVENLIQEERGCVVLLFSH